MVKYILVTGGVISGIGKGVFSSSIGTLLKACRIRVTCIKIDPYLNIDAGTFNPYEHGEVFVLDDGGEVDLDLGNYERFLDIKLHRDNNITTGKIYQSVIEKERRGDYLGKTVQVVPHVTDEIQDWVERVSKMPTDDTGLEPEVSIIELGGTVGDIEGMPFVEAFRQFQFRVGHANFCNIHVSLMPNINGEDKSKPTQASVRELRRSGLSPDFIACRTKGMVSDAVRAKIAMFCHVRSNEVLILPDCSTIFKVPTLLYEEGVVDYLKDRLQLTVSPTNSILKQWKKLGEKYSSSSKCVKIGLVGKYCQFSDAYTSVIKALEHACIASNSKLELEMIMASDLEEETRLNGNAVAYHEAWRRLCCVTGVVVPGGFGTRATEGKIAAIRWARLNHIPLLGICLGMQLMVVEFARGVLNWHDAHSSEINPSTSKPVIIEMPEHHTGIMGGTMRLGKRETIFKQECILKKLYGNVVSISERHRHRYEVNPDFVDNLEKEHLHFVGHDTEQVRMEVCELSMEMHPFFVGVQFHPEYLSRPMHPSPCYLGLVLASMNKLRAYMQRDCRLSPQSCTSDEYSSEEEGQSSSVGLPTNRKQSFASIVSN